MRGNGISMRTIKESLAALQIQRRHKIDKDNRCRQKDDGIRIVCCAQT
jgi:hypothetical protein